MNDSVRGQGVLSVRVAAARRWIYGLGAGNTYGLLFALTAGTSPHLSSRGEGRLLGGLTGCMMMPIAVVMETNTGNRRTPSFYSGKYRINCVIQH